MLSLKMKLGKKKNKLVRLIKRHSVRVHIPKEFLDEYINIRKAAQNASIDETLYNFKNEVSFHDIFEKFA